MLYFTSDLHFGHANVLRHREMFSSIEEMDEVLIKNWNKTVKGTDTVIITGDMFFRNEKPAHEYLEKLKGKKILVKGNHDAYWMRKYTEDELSRYFYEIDVFYDTKQNGAKLRFCHYPMLSWDSSRYGSLLVCGHIHGKRQGEEFEMFQKIPYAFNAGVDVNGFCPVTLENLIENNADFYERRYTEKHLCHLQETVKAYGGRGCLNLRSI